MNRVICNKIRNLGFYIAFMSVFILSFSAVSIVNGDTLKLTLEEAIALGLKNSSTIKAKTYALKAAIAQLKSAEASRYPVIHTSASWRHFFDQPKTPDMTVDMGMGEVTIPGSYTAPSDPVSLSLDISQTVYTFGQINKTIELAKRNVEMAKADLIEEKRKLIVKIKRAFYGYILAKEVKNVMRETLNNKLESLKVTRERYEAGLVPEYEVLSSETDVESFKPQVISADNQVEYALLAVKDLLGIEDEGGNFDVELVGELKRKKFKMSEEKLVDMALKNRYEIVKFNKSIKLSRINLDISKINRYPKVSAFVNYTLTSGYDSSTGENKYWGSDAWDGNLTCGVNVSIPISAFFPWSGENAEIKKNEFNLEDALIQLDSLKSSIRLQIKNILLKLDEEDAKISSGLKSIELARKLYKSSKERYAKGLISRLELSNSEVRLNNAKVSYLRAVYDYKSAIFDLMDAVGVDHF